jgi:hypothetical protein
MRLAEMLPLRLEAELLVDGEMGIHVSGLDAIGPMIDEHECLPVGA